MKKIFIILGIIIIAGILFIKLKSSLNHTLLVPLPSQSLSNSECNALTVISPKQNEQVLHNFFVKAVVDNSNPKCHWAVNEAQAGTIEVKDHTGQLIGHGILNTTQEWMTEKPVTYSGEINLEPNTPKGKLILLIKEENPSGKPGKTLSLPLIY